MMQLSLSQIQKRKLELESAKIYEQWGIIIADVVVSFFNFYLFPPTHLSIPC